jgi:alginate O-acetyltransferase complex protein AlgI
VIFRAGSLDVAWNIFQGLAAPLTLERGRHLISPAIIPIIAFALPATQDIVAYLTRRPQPWLFAVAGLVLLVILIDLGERNVVGFGYFKF